MELEVFYGDNLPKYAILSHTWEEGEVTFQDWKDLVLASQKPGFFKIKGACKQALDDNLDYIWVDTNCIDKTSSAELTEAINSMFAYYRDATVCYAFLIDVPRIDWRSSDPYYHFCQSRWFTRGWTLQELLAPIEVVFYSSDWAEIGQRSAERDFALAVQIEKATGIDSSVVRSYQQQEQLDGGLSVARKMSWLSRRVTTRVEDMAYCMLGFFDINMPLLYGEGPKAFMRLQQEIIKISNDHTIFCWTWTPTVPGNWVSLLAPSPDAFKFSGDFVELDRETKLSTYSMTNAGLSIRLPIIQTWSYYFVVLNAMSKNQKKTQACIPVTDSQVSMNNNHVRRAPFPPDVLLLPPEWCIAEQDIYIASVLRQRRGWDVSWPSSSRNRLLLTVGDMKMASGTTTSKESTPKFGDTLCMLEKTKEKFTIETYPPGLFDFNRSMFLFDHDIFQNGQGGLLRIRRGTMSWVLYLAARRAKHQSGVSTLWFSGILPASSWGDISEGMFPAYSLPNFRANEKTREETLNRVRAIVKASDESQRLSTFKGAIIMIGGRIEHLVQDMFRVAHLTFDEKVLESMLQVDEQEDHRGKFHVKDYSSS